MTQTPFTTRLVPQNAYCSGSIARKLRHAKAASFHDPRFQANVPLLEAALPPRLPIAEIDLRLGMNWIPTALIQRFILDTLKVWVDVRFNDVADTWAIPDAKMTDRTHENYTQYGVEWEQRLASGGTKTKRITGVELVELALNLKIPTVRYSDGAGGSIVHPVLTASARQKQEQIQRAFVEWLQADPERAEKIETRYNVLFNSQRLMTYDGSHLTLTGMSAEWQQKMRSRQYQLDDVWQCLSSLYNTGLWLEPGLGKTNVLIAAAMTAIAYGKAHKCIIVVQKKTLQQYRAMVPAMYPNARTLIASKGDCNKGKLDLFIARVMNSDAEITVMTHQMFEQLSLRPETWLQYVQSQLEAVQGQLQQLNPGGETCNRPTDVKRLLRMENNLAERVKALKEVHSQGLCLEDMGFNWYAFDEAHRYKRQGVFTKQYHLAGIPTGKSGCGEFFKVVRQWVWQTYGSGALIKATGTPINNSAVEAFIELWDLMPDTMLSMGLGTLDSCIAQFGLISREPEIKPNGTIAMTTRLADFVNVPELKRLLFACATVRTAEEVDLPTPPLKHITVTAPMSKEQLAYMQYLLHRTELIKAGSPLHWDREPTDDDIKRGKVIMEQDSQTGEWRQVRRVFDNNLLVSTHGREACLHYAIRDAQAPNYKYNKVYRCARRIHNIWQRTREGKATQLVFINMSTPNGENFSVYRELKGYLVTLGMPENQIAFIQDYDTEDELDEFQAKMNAGELAVAFGGEQLGVGLNVQERLFAAHLLCLPWRPDTVKQFKDRMERYGNQNESVRFYTYGTAGVNGSTGFDPFILGHLKRKDKMRTSVLSKDMTTRQLHEESDQVAFSYAQLQALLTGDERLMRLVKLETDLELKLQLVRANEIDINRMQRGSDDYFRGIPYHDRCIETAQSKLKRLAPDLDRVTHHIAQGLTADGFTVEIQGNEFTSSLEAAKAFAELAAQLLESKRFEQWLEIGTFGGFELHMRATEGRRVLMRIQGIDWYPVNFTQNPYTFGNEHRLEFSYEQILEEQRKSEQAIVRHTEQRTALIEQLQQQEEQLIPLRLEAQAIELEMLDLRKALGFEPEVISEVVIDEDEPEES